MSATNAVVTVVTGGTRGIGAAIARRLSAAGHALVLGYAHNEVAAAELATELAGRGGAVETVRADLGTDDGIDTLFDMAIERFGTVSGLVNNAGATAHIGRLTQTPVETIRAVIELNLTAAVLCARKAVDLFEAQGIPGVIVNISSAAATLGSAGEYVHYAAAKAGLDALTLGLAKETAASGVRVVGVAPGMVRTGIHADAGDPDRLERLVGRIPLGRVAEPDEIAATVAWLFTPDASYLTGTTLRVAGGL
jgi:NAD(P)-dependent dehydrogenase (short-subunit alcohol dehydrogenase family)